MADIKTNNEVETALMNGNGNPVGGIEPVNISCCIIVLILPIDKNQICCIIIFNQGEL